MTDPGHGHARRWRRRMQARDTTEAHRVATPLELLFDLCFVVAVAQAAAGLHHAIIASHLLSGVISFGLVFFAIWWAWMNFTWYASAYDVDDVPYRLMVLVQIVGVLVIAAGVPRAFDHRAYGIVTIGYAIMRVSLIACWLRAAHTETSPGRKRTARRYAAGIALAEVGWISLALLPPELWIYGWVVLCPAELFVPMWAESTGPTTWHPHHIVERYSLLTLIVIGESVLSVTVALQIEIDAGEPAFALLAMIGGAILVLFGVWWIYFAVPVRLTRERAFAWGYGHYFVFSSLAATGAGLAAAADILVGKSGQPAWVAGGAVAAPVAVFLLFVWALIIRPVKCSPRIPIGFFVAIALVLASIASPAPVLVIGAVLVGLIVLLESAPVARPADGG